MTPYTDDRDAWLEWRRHGIGASDAAALVGLSKYHSPWSLWANKVGLLPDRPSSMRQRVGKLLEPAIAELFHEVTGLHVAGEQTWCTHPGAGLEWARCTVDGFVVESPASSLAERLGTHEIKTDARFGWLDGVPPDIRAQCVWQMAVTDSTHCWLSVLHGGFGFAVYEIDWDDAAAADWDLLRTAGERLWLDHVVTGTPPAIDGSEATRRALEAVYADPEPGERVSLDHLREEIDDREYFKGEVKVLQDRIDVIDNQLREAIGDAEIGTIDDVPVLSYRWTERAGYIVAPTRYRSLRAASKKDREAA